MRTRGLADLICFFSQVLKRVFMKECKMIKN